MNIHNPSDNIDTRRENRRDANQNVADKFPTIDQTASPKDLNSLSNAAPYISRLLGQIVRQIAGPNVSVSQITGQEARSKVTALRKELYSRRRGYLSQLAQLADDTTDIRSYIYAAYHRSQMIGTVRLTPSPFEVDNYIDTAFVDEFILPGSRDKTLEISRLIIDPSVTVRRLPEALITYAGLHAFLLTSYRRYIAYAKPQLRQRSFNFDFEEEIITFKIPERGTHRYALLKGDFMRDFHRISEQHYRDMYNIL